jgi:CheY-like chemotaxis protein
MNLPDGLGTYILRRIRDERRPIRAAVLSGTSDESLLRWAVRYGAEVVIRKPLVVEQLLDWLAGPSGAPTPAKLQHV